MFHLKIDKFIQNLENLLLNDLGGRAIVIHSIICCNKFDAPLFLHRQKSGFLTMRLIWHFHIFTFSGRNNS